MPSRGFEVADDQAHGRVHVAGADGLVERAMLPVLHVDSDAPLYADVDGTLISDEPWGIYCKPDFHFGGVQGGAMPLPVARDADDVAVDLKDVTTIYPFEGTEYALFIVGMVLWILWYVWQLRFENKTYAEDLEKLDSPEKLAKVMRNEPLD